jgi:hypothetical protein
MAVVPEIMDTRSYIETQGTYSFRSQKGGDFSLPAAQDAQFKSVLHEPEQQVDRDRASRATLAPTLPIVGLQLVALRNSLIARGPLVIKTCCSNEAEKE